MMTSSIAQTRVNVVVSRARTSSSSAARGRSARVCVAQGLSRDVEAVVTFTRNAAFALGVAAVMTSASPAMAKDGKNGVYWVSPQDGAQVEEEFTAKFGVKGYELAPASEGLQEGTGHHHIVIDGTFVEKGQAIPFDDTHLHYGKAQKEGIIKLSPGPHTLTLQFANAKHESFGQKFSKTISVCVGAEPCAPAKK
jgi:hypothetical protein